MRVFQISDSEPGVHNRCEYIFIRAVLADSNRTLIRTVLLASGLTGC